MDPPIDTTQNQQNEATNQPPSDNKETIILPKKSTKIFSERIILLQFLFLKLLAGILFSHLPSISLSFLSGLYSCLHSHIFTNPFAFRTRRISFNQCEHISILSAPFNHYHSTNLISRAQRFNNPAMRNILRPLQYFGSLMIFTMS